MKEKEEVMDVCECDPCDDKCAEAYSALKKDVNTHRSYCLSSEQELLTFRNMYICMCFHRVFSPDALTERWIYSVFLCGCDVL